MSEIEPNRKCVRLRVRGTPPTQSRTSPASIRLFLAPVDMARFFSAPAGGQPQLEQEAAGQDGLEVPHTVRLRPGSELRARGGVVQGIPENGHKRGENITSLGPRITNKKEPKEEAHFLEDA